MVISTPRAVFTPLWSQKTHGISPSNEVRIKLKENSELDKNGYRYVFANNAVYKFKSAQAGKAKYALRTKRELNESKDSRKMKRGIKLFAHRLF